MPGSSDLSLAVHRPTVVRRLGGIALLAWTLVAVPLAMAQETKAPPRIANEDIFRKNNLPFQKAVKESSPAGASRDLLVNGAKFYVDRMTIPDNSAKLVEKTDQYLNNYVYGPGTTKAAEAILHQATIDRCQELLAEDPPHPPVVTVNLVTLLSRLYAAKGNFQKGTPPVPLVATSGPLMSVLDSEVLPIPTKIRAAKHLGTIGLNAVNGVAGGDLAITNRDAIVASLVRAMKSPAAQGLSVGPCWYREALVEAIGNCDLPMTLAGSSDPIDAVMARLVDRNEDIKVRAASARALSQMSLNASFNAPLIIHETVLAAYHLGHEFNAKPVAQRTGTHKWAAAYLYFAFKPELQTQAQAPKSWGLLQLPQRSGLAPQKPLVEAAFAVSKPISLIFINTPNLPPVVPVVDLNSALEWLEKNAPANRKLTSKSPAIPAPKERGAYDPPGAPAAPPATPAPGAGVIPATVQPDPKAGPQPG